jgi:hypothetical protein
LQLNSDGKDEESSDDDYLGYEQVWDKEGPPIHPPGRGLPPGLQFLSYGTIKYV